MAKVKHNPDASVLIDEGISKMEPFAQAICKKLRQIILSADTAMIEDWKWGPNYYLEGMVCGYWGFKKHVTLTFFQGVLLKDKRKLLFQNPGNVHNRHMKFTNLKDIDEEVILEYLFEAIDNNRKGMKIIETKNKIVDVPDDVLKAFKNAKVLDNFNGLAFSHRKEYIMWITDAKKDETRTRRIEQSIEKLKNKQSLHDMYKNRLWK